MIRGGTRGGLVLAVTLALAGCATVASQPHKLPDGSYQIACAETLATCLQAFEQVCAWHGYDVISAKERRRHGDLRDVPVETITSEAQVRCKPGEALFGGTTSAPPAPAPAAPAATAEPPSIAASTLSCRVPAADGGAPSCDGEPDAASPR
jgi:hypothetical protein